jgi:hypothetical protein
MHGAPRSKASYGQATAMPQVRLMAHRRHARGVLTTPSGSRVPSVHKRCALTVDTLSGEVVIKHTAEP